MRCYWCSTALDPERSTGFKGRRFHFECLRRYLTQR